MNATACCSDSPAGRMRAVLASPKLAAEYWTSFAALVRSHLAMRSVAEPAANWRLLRDAGTHLEAEGAGRRLQIAAPDGEAAGRVEFQSSANAGPDRTIVFSFCDDGQVCFWRPASSAEAEDAAGMDCMNCKDMEAAVEFLLDEIGKREDR